MNKPFSKQLLAWYHKHGRHDLPWQSNTTPYRVWISEIMLQQTQVATVIPYYLHFMRSFPTLKTLATAPEDQVLAHWSGLGYYARARNIHKTAKIIIEKFSGKFPDSATVLETLPGIGKSTAGAIVSFSQKKYAVICDGNVKRVLSRYCAIDNPDEDLWPLAEKFTPKTEAHFYNQAIMDLGATLCTRTKPQCIVCPLKKNCLAHCSDNAMAYPVKKEKKSRPVKQVMLLMIENKQGELLLLKRPSEGIWGGLWSLPEAALQQPITSFRRAGLRHVGELPKLVHQFTHFTLEIFPQRFLISRKIAAQDIHWHDHNNPLPGGVPAPVGKLLQRLTQHT